VKKTAQNAAQQFLRNLIHGIYRGKKVAHNHCYICIKKLLKVNKCRVGKNPPFWSPWFQAGLPDGLFSNQNSQIRYIMEGLGIENVVIFYDNFE
jgi:hypothetical protein